MKYKNTHSFSHSQQDKIGVLITNLGTPDAPTKQALRPYLKEFLSDPRVVEVPRLLWWCILNGIILNVRPKRSAHAYASVWTENGSPLLNITQKQAEKLQLKLKQSELDNIELEFAMRYGNPSIESGIEKLLEKGVRKLLVFPLYPQYAAATTASTFDAIAKDFTQRRWIPELRFISSYHDHPDYIHALASSIEEHRKIHGKSQKILFSYHGIPLRYLHNGDPYHCQCHKTTRLVAEKLGLEKDEYLTTFQSRFGREEWLKPYTDETLKALPSQGIEHVQMICPGFSADCLETIEEIGEENREYFMESGGKKYEYIPALNDQDMHIDVLFSIIRRHLSGWEIQEEHLGERDRLFKNHKENKTK